MRGRAYGRSRGVGVAAVRGEPEHRRFRTSLAIAITLTAVGQAIADASDIFHRSLGTWALRRTSAMSSAPCWE